VRQRGLVIRRREPPSQLCFRGVHGLSSRKAYGALSAGRSVSHRELEVVRLDEKKKTRRPLKLTEARFRRTLALIGDGNTNSAACRIEGVHYTTWREHIQQKPHSRAELGEAEKIRDEVWRDHALEMIKNAMPKSWQAATTYLERRYPSAWALRSVNRSPADIEQQAFCDKISLEQLVENAKLAAEIAANPPPGSIPKQPTLPESETVNSKD
jgi:hypothetical protein